ncbi:MAG: PSD1 and planctomycete cytochrome C domain-containing protein [Acidobacteriia bacterium]|nr:PSD1 and planctomycete cytochrome C domain-containing protein [Terriglobia bacterium]
MFHQVPEEESDLMGGRSKSPTRSSSLSRIGGLRIAFVSAVILALAARVAWLRWPHEHPLFAVFSARRVDFSRDIRPILNQNCTSCHGGVRQKSGVSFIFREEALGTGKSGRPTIVPGDPDASELIARVTSKDPDTRMPYHAPPLSPEQISLLRQWIKEGAKWSDYWAFVPPQPQPLPAVKHMNWVRQPLDRFVLARLERESLLPSAEADKAALLRRVSLDLTGLPPTAEEQASFLDDQSQDAYEKQVDRLLASSAYGERWASMWLDLARYADSMGYEADQRRLGVWAYRDWVIHAYNRNLPYDQFVTTQLAGDLLPNATFEDRIATSFHRQTPNNQEGGTDDEEFRLVAVMDRVATTWSVLNGVTMNCVQCHSHPYDPIRHADYYKSLAFFNTSNDADRDDDFPTLRFPKDRSRYAEASQAQQQIKSLLHTVVTSDRAMVEKAEWKQLPIQAAAANEIPALEQRLPADEKYLAELQKGKDAPAAKAAAIADQRERIKSVRKRLALAKARGGPAKTFHIRDGEARADPSTPPQSYYELVATSTLPVVTAIRVEVPPVNPEKARHTPEDGFIVERVQAAILRPDGHKDRIAFRCFIQDSEENLEAAVSPVGAKKNSRNKEVADGFAGNPKLFGTRWIVGIPAEPLKVAPKTRIEIDLKQVREIDYKPAPIQRVRLALSDDPRWTSLSQDPARVKAIRRLADLEQTVAKIPAVDVPVMSEEQPYERRTTLEFERGNFLTKIGPDLAPDVPGIFPRLPDDAPRNRLTFAQWFFLPGQPLTARVAVNRYWEQLFGTGIVETLENFGSAGEGPSHPELLDWLALHFQNDLHWDMKALLRELVTSATYRQRAATTPALRERDPRNRLLARGPQQRLTAEMVRDQALLASGLLNRTMGGLPVMPPQPPGVWNSVYNSDKWKDATGPNRYRRAIYTFVKRTSGYPSSLIFDASDRTTSLPRRIPTNTPLQALVTLNDPVYEEAAEALARRAVKDAVANAGSGSDGESILDARLSCEARLVLSRDPTSQELAVLRELFKKSVTTPSRPTLRAASMRVLEHSAHESEISSNELHGLKAVGNVLLNLDAALNR